MRQLQTIIKRGSLALLAALVAVSSMPLFVQPASAAIQEKIVYSFGGGLGLAMINPDGTGRTVIPNTGIAFLPALSPDGTKIAYKGEPNGRGDIMVINVDGTNKVNLTGSIPISEENLPAWSPDGSKIAFYKSSTCCGPQEPTGVYVMNADGSDVHLVVARAYWPSWSPDGKLIFEYTPPTGGPAQLATANADGTGLTTIPTNNVTYNGGAAWSPDGTRIAYVTHTPPYSIAVMNADGSNGTVLFSASEGKSVSFPQWSPDSSLIVFDSELGVTAVPSTGGQAQQLFASQEGVGGRFSWGFADITPDTVAPAVTGTPDVPANAAGWHNQDVTVTWASADPTPSSGTPTTPPPTVANLEGTHTYTSGQSCDPAGNCATGSLSLSIDKTAPSISYSLSPLPNIMGWNNTQVVVTFTCADNANANQSGIASCTAPVTVPAGTTVVSVPGTAVDVAGNTATANVTVSVDDIKPLISYAQSPLANANGWNNTDVTVSFTCDDAFSLVFTCSPASTVSTEGVNQAVLGSALDNAGNVQTVNAAVNIDKTAPALGMFNWGNTNPKPLTASAALTVPATDATSGISRAEYFVGATDPGEGNGTVMTLANQQTSANGAVVSADLTASFGTNLATGSYDIHVRTQDKAGNWSTVGTGTLVVFDAAGPTDFTASKQAVPVYGADILPGLLNANQNDKADLSFDALFTPAGTVDAASYLALDYSTGNGCDPVKHPAKCDSIMTFNATTISPNAITLLTLSGANSSLGSFQGTGTLTINGVTTTNPFRIAGKDGSRTTPATNDDVTLYIFAPGSTMASGTELYRLHITTGGNWLKIN